MQIPSVFPDNLKDITLSTQEFGLPGSVWRLEDVSEVIDWLDKNPAAILPQE